MRNLFLLAIIVFILPVESKADNNDIKKGIELFEKSDFSGAKTFFESYLKQNPSSDTAVFYLGRIFFQEKNFDKSIEFFEKAVKMKDKNSGYHFWLGIVSGRKAQDASVLKQPGLAKKMKNEMEMAINLDPSNLNARINLAMFYIKAPGIMGGSFEKANEQAKEIKKLDYLQGLNIYMEIYKQEGKFDLAEKEIQNGIEKFPENTDLQFQLAYVYEELKNYEKAIFTFERIIKIDPTKIYAYYRIGRVGAMFNTNSEKAADCLKKYIQSGPAENLPSLAWGHYRLGMVYENLGDKNLAKSEYETALSLDPNHKEAKAALSKL